MNDPLLDLPCELIIEDKIHKNDELKSKMMEDISSMNDITKNQILETMLKMHEYFEEECGDLDVSLNTTEEISINTEPQYIILEESSDDQTRAIRYHYKSNWETGHGVEVIVLNGDKVIFVGNCGYASTIERVLSLKEEEFNFV